MNYQTFQPCSELSALIKFYWTLEVPFDPNNEKQKIIPDGCIEMTFNFGDPIKRYTSEDEYIIHPNSMIMGQRTKSFCIEPTGNVNSFAVCFYPYGFANFVDTPLEQLVDVEAPLEKLFGESLGGELIQKVFESESTKERIEVIEAFLLNRLNQEKSIENLVTSTVDALIESKGTSSINQILKDTPSKRRQLERNFKKQIGISPKQLGKVLRLHTALKMVLDDKDSKSKSKSKSLTSIAYESEYFDQAHFIKDFKELIGTTPKEFLGDKSMELAALFYR